MATRAAATLGAAARFHELRAVVTDLCVFDFETPDGRARLKSLHPGVTIEDVQSATGFTLLLPEGDIPVTDLPSGEELRILRDEVDPTGMRLREFE